MNFIEFIGFAVSILAMAYLFVKQAMDQRRRRADPEAYEREVKEREELIRKLMHGENVHPSAHRSISKKNGHSPSQRPAIKIPKEMPKKKGAQAQGKPLSIAPVPKKGRGMDPYALNQVLVPSPIERALDHLDSRKELVILSEIYGPPKGFQ